VGRRRQGAVGPPAAPVRLALQVGAVAGGAVFAVDPLAECDEGLVGGVGARRPIATKERQTGGHGHGHEYDNEYSSAHGGIRSCCWQGK